MSRHIYVINPNSLDSVTKRIDRALDPLRRPGGPEIHCVTTEKGPPGVQTQEDVDRAGLLVGEKIIECEAAAARQGGQASAFVIACFSDPGLFCAREKTRAPVFGIAESGFLSAMSYGLKVGVISILAGSIPRHWRYFASMGVTDRLAADLPIGLGVEALETSPDARKRLLDTGRRLVEEHGADVLLLGCAGMTDFRAMLEDEVQRPVVDPTLAATVMALGHTLLANPA